MSSLNGSTLFITAFIIFSVSASVVDIKKKRIPDLIIFPGIVVLLALRSISFGDPLLRILLDMVIGFLIFFGIRFITKGKLGMGDVKFAAFIALFLGFPFFFAAVAIASLTGLAFALAGLAIGRISKTTKIPFAPFLTAGSIIVSVIKNIYL